MNNDMTHAMTQFFDTPVTYNPLIAKALKSTKAAILLDYLIERESVHGFLNQSNQDMADETGLGLTELRTALLTLESNQVISRSSATGTLNKIIYEVSPYFMNDLFAKLEQQRGIDEQLTFDMLSPISINRQHVLTIKDLGGSVNASILLSFLLGMMSAQDRAEKNDFTQWFEANDKLWLGMTGMTDKELRNAKKTLINLGYLVRGKQGMPASVCFCLNIKHLADTTWAYAMKTKPARKRPAARSEITQMAAYA